jgi:hypothetical protein
VATRSNSPSKLMSQYTMSQLKSTTLERKTSLNTNSKKSENNLFYSPQNSMKRTTFRELKRANSVFPTLDNAYPKRFGSVKKLPYGLAFYNLMTFSCQRVSTSCLKLIKEETDGGVNGHSKFLDNSNFNKNVRVKSFLSLYSRLDS